MQVHSEAWADSDKEIMYVSCMQHFWEVLSWLSAFSVLMHSYIKLPHKSLPLRIFLKQLYINRLVCTSMLTLWWDECLCSCKYILKFMLIRRLVYNYYWTKMNVAGSSRRYCRDLWSVSFGSGVIKTSLFRPTRNRHVVCFRASELLRRTNRGLAYLVILFRKDTTPYTYYKETKDKLGD